MAVTAADAEVARINGTWLITNLSGASATLSPESCEAGRRRSAACADARRREPGDNPLVRGGRPPAGEGPHQAAGRVRGHRGAGRRGRPARAARPRPVERAGRDASARSRNAPSRTASSRATSGTFACCSLRTPARTSSRSTPGCIPTGRGESADRRRPGGRERAATDRARDRSSTASGSCPRPRTSASFARSARRATARDRDAAGSSSRNAPSAGRGAAPAPQPGAAARHRPQPARHRARPTPRRRRPTR